ncbi:MAG: DNA translocase FtsK 4TM domain-containing protein [Collinsella sp.]|nr:DNA translocase FtsK 4TM domain-containing protein [Collinsella sp.]
MLDGGAAADIVGVVLAVLAVASFIAVVTPSSAPLTHAVAQLYHLGFGLGAYVIPLVMLAASVLLFLRGAIHVPARILGGVALIFVALESVLSLNAPNTGLSTVGMFESEALATCGGYLGAFVASALQNALGKTISLVVLIGLVLLGLVIIGFSVGDMARAVASGAEQLVRRRRPDVNAAPWGDASVGSSPHDDACKPDQAQRPLFDDEGTLDTTYLGNRSTSVLDRSGDEPEEDPILDVSDQIAAERAKTTLIPVREHFAPRSSEVDAVPAEPASAPRLATSDLDVISAPGGGCVSDDLPWDDDEDADDSRVQTPAAGAAADSPAMPDFLRAHATASSHQKGGQGSAEAPRDAAGDKAAEPEGRVAKEPETPVAQEGLTLPPASILRHNPASAKSASSDKELEQTANALQSTLSEFNLHSRVVGWISGPTVTTFKVQPGEGERVSRISSLEDDIALSLASTSVRIFAPIPGTSLVGIEIPNRTRQNVNLGDVLPYAKGGPLVLAIGRDAEGAPIVADLAKMPHLLIAGTTGSGKSVMINSIVMSMLMRSTPEDVRLIMVDPKRVELAGYNGLPHLYVPVVTEPKQAASALQWGVSEMERRLKVFERIGVRNISTFNAKQQAGEFERYDNPPAKMPYLVIIIDELSDLMMVAGKDVEASIVRIAQLGRAAGIHLIVATQRPSSNVVTGLIKANITNRIAFNVATGIDSRVIIDQMGAEKLTGYGDMLFSKVDWGKPKRIQGCFVSDDEINQVVEFVKEQGAPDYHEEILSAVAPAMVGGASASSGHEPSDDDPLIWEAAQIVVESQLGSTSGLQRRLKVGYARAGRIMDMLEEKGVVGPPDGSKPREVLLDEEGLAALQRVEAQMAEDDGYGGL